VSKVLSYYKIYAKVKCPFCVDTINKMNEHGLDYALILIDKSPDYLESIKKIYDHDTVPIIVKVSKINGKQEFIGGSDDFQKFLHEEGYEEC
jgi:glutaredoxin